MTVESKFTTIRDMHVALTALIEEGLGALPVQILVAPDSTMQAIARHAGAKDDDKPALMIELTSGLEGRIPATIISTERLQSSSPRVAIQ